MARVNNTFSQYKKDYQVGTRIIISRAMTLIKAILVWSSYFIACCYATSRNLTNPCGGTVVAPPAGLRGSGPPNGLSAFLRVLESSAAEAQRLFNIISETRFNANSLMVLRDRDIETPAILSGISQTLKSHGLMITNQLLRMNTIKDSLASLYEVAVKYTKDVFRMSRVSRHFHRLRRFALDQMCCLQQVLQSEGIWNRVDITIVERAELMLKQFPHSDNTLQNLLDLAFFIHEYVPQSRTIAQNAELQTGWQRA